MIKLLDKPFKAFALYALLILIFSIPVYFLVVDWIWVSELDDNNKIIQERIEHRFGEAHIPENELKIILETWNLLQPSSSIIPLEDDPPRTDSIYEVTKYNEYENESDRFRGLQSDIFINNRLYQLNIETNIEESYETMFAIGLVTIILYGILVFGFIVLNRKISTSVWEPFKLTLQKLKSFDLGKGNEIQFDHTEIEEFAQMNRAIESLITQNIKIFNQQKAFIANASHELQTPIALLKSKLELLLQQENLNKKQSEILNAIQIPLARLTRVNKNLLLLARIENGRFDDMELVDLELKVEKSEILLQDYIDEKQLVFKKVIRGECKVRCSRFLSETVVNNLLSNAIRHTPVSGSIEVILDEKGFELRNTGVSPLHKEFLFRRFSVATTETTNSGLGLAIVKEICDQCHWQISYDFRNSLHVFRISFQ